MHGCPGFLSPQLGRPAYIPTITQATKDAIDVVCPQMLCSDSKRRRPLFQNKNKVSKIEKHSKIEKKVFFRL